MLRYLRAPLLVLLAAGLAGCGSDPVELDGPVLEMRLDEFQLVPQDVEASAGRLVIRARNVGRLTHNVRVLRIPEDREGRAKVIGGTPTAQPGEVTSGDVRLAPGTYRLACTIANHDDLGMHGELEVR